MGTLAFVSPEQAEGKHVDARSDIFSFGAVLFQMATGKRAFTGTSMTAVMGAAILRAGLPDSGGLFAGNADPSDQPALVIAFRAAG